MAERTVERIAEKSESIGNKHAKHENGLTSEYVFANKSYVVLCTAFCLKNNVIIIKTNESFAEKTTNFTSECKA